MKSRITIEVDFDASNQPVIQVISQNSDDVRDRLLSNFLQSLQHTSRWCKIIYIAEIPVHGEGEEYAKYRWNIVPVKPDEIKAEIKLMEATLAEMDKHQ